MFFIFGVRIHNNDCMEWHTCSQPVNKINFSDTWYNKLKISNDHVYIILIIIQIIINSDIILTCSILESTK